MKEKTLCPQKWHTRSIALAFSFKHFSILGRFTKANSLFDFRNTVRPSSRSGTWTNSQPQENISHNPSQVTERKDSARMSVSPITQEKQNHSRKTVKSRKQLQWFQHKYCDRLVTIDWKPCWRMGWACTSDTSRPIRELDLLRHNRWSATVGFFKKKCTKNAKWCSWFYVLCS